MFTSFKPLQGIFFKAMAFGLIVLVACDPEREQIDADPALTLAFSTDTIFFDTVFTSLGSITKRVTVINPHDKAVNISRISLGGVANSPYSLIIHGKEQNSLENIRLLGDDSLLVLAKVTIDPMDQDLPFEVKDSIVLETNGNVQDVKLIAWGQDANFIRSDSLFSQIDCDGMTTWTAERPYVIYDSLFFVPKGCELKIEAGTQIHFNVDAAMIIDGKLTVEGTPNDQVVFQSLRTDEPFDESAGQWGDASGIIGGISITRAGEASFDWTLIKNGIIGIQVGRLSLDGDDELTPRVIIQNTEIRNMAIAGIQAVTAQIDMTNTLIHNYAENGAAFLLGGNYSLTHCTIASFQVDFIRNGTSLLATNVLPVSDTEVIAAPLNITMRNSIVWGGFPEELDLIEEESVDFILDFNTNILRTEEEGFEGGNLVNQDPRFYDPFDERVYFLGEESAAIDRGLPDLGITHDLLNNQRDDLPDLGAYEFFEIEEEEDGGGE